VLQCSKKLMQTKVVLNPLNPTDPNIMSDTDLAGPLVFCLLFGAMLLLVSNPVDWSIFTTPL